MKKRNLDKSFPDFKLQWESDSDIPRDKWELYYRFHMMENFRFFEFDDDDLMSRFLSANKQIKGMFVSPTNLEIRLEQKHGQNKALFVMASKIKNSFKAYNLGSKQKESINKGKVKSENWDNYVKTKCI